jgi:transcriptional regulator with XRE-family HTH domain
VPRKTPDTPLYQLRRTRTMSQQDLARLSGISQQSLSKMERGLIDPRFDVKARLAAILGTTPTDLFPKPDAEAVAV